MNFLRHKAKFLLGISLFFTLLMWFSVFSDFMDYNSLLDYVSHIGWFLTSLWLAYFIFKAYKIFQNKNLLLGLIGFGFISAAYTSIFILETGLKLSVLPGFSFVEVIIINFFITLGYLVVSISSLGVLKST